jgi:hypothetical protein
MVSKVVAVLDEGSAYLLPGRILRSRVPKKHQPQRKIKPIFPSKTTGKNQQPQQKIKPTLPAKTTGERESSSKSKEKDRKEKKELAGHTPLRWDGHSWLPRKRDSDYYKEKLRNHTSRKERSRNPTTTSIRGVYSHRGYWCISCEDKTIRQQS